MAAEAWKKVKLLLGQTNSPAPTEIEHDGVTVNEPAEIAGIFADFFYDKPEQVRAQRQIMPAEIPIQNVRDWLRDSGKFPPKFTFKPVSQYKVRMALK